MVLLMTAPSVQADHHIANVVVKVESLVPENGVYFTPVWVGFHNGSFDLFDVGSLASEGVERIAEDGNVSVLREEFAAATADSGGIDGVITSPAGFEALPVFDPGEISTAEFTLTVGQNRYMSFASMIIPSNDAFIGNHNPWAIELFDAAGTFNGKKIITVLGSMVWDAGTELNTEMDAAFINQTGPDMGVTTVSPIIPHPGFLGSYGNPGSDPIILGGTNAAGKISDPAGADFTLPYAVVARITIESASVEGSTEMSAYELLSNGRGNGPVIYVTSQGLYYDSIVTADPLPQKGPFQLLVPTLDGLITEYGPGDVGYVGGRWVMDSNGDGEQNEGDHFFMCPLLPPGRSTGPQAARTTNLLSVGGGATTANGWYEGEEIYYILSGVEEGVTQRGQNDLYLIGGDRAFQANVAEFIPGEPGYSPHWNVNVVNTAEGVTLADILASPYMSAHYPEALFDDVEDILGAWEAGLVTINKPGKVVLCPIISEEGAEAPGNTELPEVFLPFPSEF